MKDKQAKAAGLRIQMLGPFQVRRQDETLTWPTQKSKALFQILLIEPGRFVPTDQILEYLWPDLSPRRAQNNLWVTVSQLRRVLQPDLPPRGRSAFILKQGEGYVSSSEADYWLDGDEFVTHLAAAQSAIDWAARIAAWDAARTLYQGDFLEDEPYAEWAQIPRLQWQRRYEQLLINLAEAQGKNGRFQQAIAHCREALALDNANETAYRLLMRCHAALGDRATALKVYDEAVQALQDEIGVDPMPETTELAHQLQQLKGDWGLVLSEAQGSETVHSAMSTLQPGTSAPFVGRGQEMDLLARLLTQTATGQGQLALVSGEPGIGKTRLVQEAAVLARRQGFQVLNTRCYLVEQSMPYQPLIDLARQMIALDDHWQRLAPAWLRELAVLLPETGDMPASAAAAAPPADEPAESPQARLYQAIFHLFARQAARHKLLLVAEDIHWADPATLQCLHYLARHIVPVPIALILTLRGESGAADVGLVALRHSLRREAHVISLPLMRLTEADTTALLAQTADTAPYANRLSAWLHQETAGNPFFFVSTLQSLREKGLLDNAAETDWQALARTDSTLALPDAIQDLVRDRLQRLAQAEREALEWVAVYGRGLDFSTLQAISRQPQMTLLNAVERLGELQLLAERTGQYDFDHNKIREVVYHDLSAARRGLYHRQIADTLEAVSLSPEKASLLAHTYAYRQAVRHYERALALVDQPAAQMDVCLGLGRAFTLLDDHQAATAAIRQGLDLAERYGDNARRARLLYVQAQNASYVQAQNASRQHRSDGGKPEVEAALGAAEHASDEYYQVQSLLLLTEVHESSGHLCQALQTAARARVSSHKLNDNQLEARALAEIGFLRALRAEFDKAAYAAERGLKLLAETDGRNAIAYTWNILGRALGGRGDYSRALDAFRRSQEEAQTIGDRYLLAQASNMLGWLHRELGDFESALRFDREGVELAQRWDKPSPEISARLNVCLDVLHLGDPEQALALLEEIEVQINAGTFGFHNWRWRLRLLHARGLCFLALHQPAEALASAEDGLPLAEAKAARKYVALNHELRGIALKELGNQDEAISALEMAVSLADLIQYQPIRWASRQRLAEMYRQQGREQEAQRSLSEGTHIIHSIAAVLTDESLRGAFLRSQKPQRH